MTAVVHVDNEKIEHGLCSGHSCDPLTQCLLHEIYGFCFTHNLTLHPVRITSTGNALANLLSHYQFSMPPLHPAWGSPRLLPRYTGTAWCPALETVLKVPPPPSTLSVHSTLAPKSPASLICASSSLNGSVACQPQAVLTTPPSTNLVIVTGSAQKTLNMHGCTECAQKAKTVGLWSYNRFQWKQS
ncbi:uncharacterized protein UBRO_20496 [Ustilago bromivora]|uniref:Uncharacterized protein n=1 Tax=Ustilago bromivora TaxID=307758 RepID=A0A1K0GYT2_9BASI|nr:uncharacterized protein UBRO_20496 [Ustilago bromivora]